MRVTVCTKDQTHDLGERFVDYLKGKPWKGADKRIYARNRKEGNRGTVPSFSDWLVN